MLELRDRMRRFAMAALVLSQGVPMILMGDENGRSQKGNNNAYCQDNELAWMDWNPEPREAAMLTFLAGALRLRSELPLLAAEHWLRGQPVAEGGLRAVRWLRPDGVPMSEAEWANGSVKAMAVAFAGSGRVGGARPDQRRRRGRALPVAALRRGGSVDAPPRQRRRGASTPRRRRWRPTTR